MHDSGEVGPYAPADFLRLFGVINEPPPVEIDAELAALGLEVDLADAAHSEALDAWRDSMRELESNPGPPRRGDGVNSEASHYVVNAGSAVDEARARAALNDADDVLGAARVAYNTLARRLQEGRAADTYRADQEILAEQRAAARAVREPTERRRLRSLRRKVAG